MTFETWVVVWNTANGSRVMVDFDSEDGAGRFAIQLAEAYREGVDVLGPVASDVDDATMERVRERIRVRLGLAPVTYALQEAAS